MRTTLLLAGLSGTALLARGMALEPATPARPPMTLRQPRVVSQFEIRRD
jgi:hypothetical protein